MFDHRNPFTVTGPAVISFSGGRSSAMLLRRVLDAHRGALPADVHVVFANTGRERHETLEFVRQIHERWTPVTWLERSRAGFCEVTFETASRNGEPFAELIAEKRFLPNPWRRFCTIDLKIMVTAAFMRSHGYSDWTNVVGLRYDEERRVMSLRARPADWSVRCPLYDAHVCRPDVAAFWRGQSFRLALEPHESNCDLCFNKSSVEIERILRSKPELAAWWIAQETLVGARFRRDETYAATAERVRLPVVSEASQSDDATLPCGCTE